MLEAFYTPQGTIVAATLILLSAFLIAKKVVSIDAVIVGIVFGIVVFLFGGIASFAALLVFFVAGEGTTRLARHTSEKHERRNYLNILGNAGAGIIALFLGQPIAFFGSMAAALGDTLSSEIGMLSKKNPILITTFKQVARGTDGGVTSLGFAANFAGALAIALIFYFMVEQNILLAFILIIAGFSGGIMDSILGAVFERKGKMSNTQVNFAASAVGAITAFVLAGFI